MKKIIGCLLIMCSASFAISLEEVKRDLNKSFIHEDSLEARFTTKITSSAIGSQTMESYYVRKGPKKIYFEMRSPLLNQRVIVSGDRIKIVDLKSKQETIVKNGTQFMSLMSIPESSANPFEKGNWKEPVFESESVYKIEGDSATYYYDEKKKQLVKMERVTQKNNSLTTFEYDPATKRLSAIKISVLIDMKETVIEIVYSKYQNSRNFPDSNFKF